MHKEEGLTVYDTFDELLKAPILFSTEYDGYYYIKVKPEYEYDESVYKVDIRTKKISTISIIDYFDIEDKVKPVVLSK